jgi:predicted transcriptional regulator
MTPAQCRATRGLIDMSQEKLAGFAVVPTSLIADYESRTIAMRATDVEAIRRALEKAGVEFIDSERPGVRLKKAGK